MSPNDVQWWSLVVGLGLFMAVVVVTFAIRSRRERRHGPSLPAGDFVVERGSSSPATGSVTPRTGPRRKPTASPPAGEPRELASAIRSAILRAVAERAPTGWTALILAPPPHPDRMTWHVHLAPEVGLDLRDGRTVTVAPPQASHDWRLAGGRTIGVGDGDPDPPPGDETATVRVTGPYLILTVGRDAGQGLMLVARVVLAEGDELPQPRGVVTDHRAVQGALREAIELTVGSRMTGPAPAAGYPLASWRGHERIWLTIGR